jgi:hypothetical protein
VVRNLRGGANGGAAGIDQPLGGHRQGHAQPRDRVYLRLGAFVDTLPFVQRGVSKRRRASASSTSCTRLDLPTLKAPSQR